ADARADALADLAPLLPPDLRTQALQEALAAARQIEDEDARADALADLAPLLPPDLRTQALQETLAAARQIEDEDDRARALADLASGLAGLPRAELYALWRETLRVLAARRRRSLLSDLGALKEVILALGTEKALEETARAILDVGRWWP
ncbi:MAG: hypothetical protein H5T60_09380, partial [Anaerolineae bacterium]|nr:hypothetical protein [Anaerolineae bacterium]